MEEGNLLTFEFPFREDPRCPGHRGDQISGETAPGEAAGEAGTGRGLFAQVVLEPVRGSRRRFGLVLPEGRGPGLAALGVAGREGDLAW